MSDIEKYYKIMLTKVGKSDYQSAYATYKVLNNRNNKLSNLMNSDKNYRCFLDADYEKSSYKWSQEYPGRKYGGPIKSTCILWQTGCKPTKTIYDPCAEYTLARDYIDCIEDHARPTYGG